jgi:hypothetical protein
LASRWRTARGACLLQKIQRRQIAMQRSPVIFWLLLAATLAIDAVSMSNAFHRPSNTTWVIAYDALVAGQLSALSIWASLRRCKNFWTRVAPVAAVLVAAAVVGLFGKPPFVDVLPYYGLQVAAIMAIVWMLDRTSFWQWRTGSSAKWQYSVFELLVLMTVVAMLATTLRATDWFSGSRWINLAFICGSVSLAVAGTVVWTMSWHWLLRASGTVAFALLLGVAFMVTMEPFLPQFLTAHYLIQAIELSLWFAVGGIIPRDESNAVAASSVEQGPVQT